MKAFEAFIVISTIAIGTYLTNKLLIHLMNLFSDLNSDLLCSESSKTPSTLRFIRNNLLTWTHFRHAHSPSTTSAASRGYLTSLPRRSPSNASPNLSSIEKQEEDSSFSKLRTLMASLAEKYPDHMYLGHSTFTAGGNISVWSRSRPCPPQRNDTAYHGEIAHVHASTGTIHIIMHPSDTSLATKQGWVRDSASSQGQYCTLAALHDDDAELQTVEELIKAAMWYARGQGVDGMLREEESVMPVLALDGVL